MRISFGQRVRWTDRWGRRRFGWVLGYRVRPSGRVNRAKVFVLPMAGRARDHPRRGTVPSVPARRLSPWRAWRTPE